MTKEEGGTLHFLLSPPVLLAHMLSNHTISSGRFRTFFLARQTDECSKPDTGQWEGGDGERKDWMDVLCLRRTGSRNVSDVTRLYRLLFSGRFSGDSECDEEEEDEDGESPAQVLNERPRK